MTSGRLNQDWTGQTGPTGPSCTVWDWSYILVWDLYNIRLLTG